VLRPLLLRSVQAVVFLRLIVLNSRVALSNRLMSSYAVLLCLLGFFVLVPSDSGCDATAQRWFLLLLDVRVRRGLGLVGTVVKRFGAW
jgi:hypothetical protein